LKIHPLAAIFAVLVGAEIGGIVGICLAVPMMASHYGLNIQGCAGPLCPRDGVTRAITK